ncbi:nicotinate-nicotinamide nucleotide adenylyltransferase [Anaerotignum sp.]
MGTRLVYTIYKEIQAALSDKNFLKQAALKKKEVFSYLKKTVWLERIEAILQQGEVSSEAVLSLCREAMDAIAGKAPEKGWLPHIYDSIIKEIYPERKDLSVEPVPKGAVLFYLEVLRVFLQWEKENLPYERTRDFRFATAEEIAESPYLEQYIRFLTAFRQEYVQELMRIGREVMPFDTLAHVAGVHHIAMHVGRQLAKAGVPVDLGLISGAAAGHDIGKYGCRDIEMKRIPYLHYYYTDLWFRRHDLQEIGHIAANHSTWDLELENLPVESLILIYADFRVKNNGYANGREIMGFYTLADSFRVILNKLDNVDTAKENRYRHVYSRLVDFEEYMKDLGVNVDLTEEHLSQTEQKEWALLTTGETVDLCKHLAIDHNIRLMDKLSRETSFGDILEAARSTADWKDSRAYLNIFSEYHTYMTQKQKQMTCAFLYELLIHREGDIRRQAAELLGTIIARYDVEYGKELPADANIVLDETDSFALWGKYLSMIVVPDHKMNDRHKRWLGYGLKRVVISLAESSRKENGKKYLSQLMAYYEKTDWAEDTAFVLIDTMLSIPRNVLTEGEKSVFLSFLEKYADCQGLEVRAAVLLVLEKMDFNSQRVPAIAATVSAEENVALEFLQYLIAEKYEVLPEDAEKVYARIFEAEEVVSDIFLENLKAATPWKLKIIHIQLLYERMKRGCPMPKLHVAAHLSNLLKVSEQVTVRHTAGETLVRLAPFLSWDQLNEITIELTKGLEIGAFEFSKYIPQYLGQFVLYLHPRELDEFLLDLHRLLISTNERVASVALDTIGVMVRHYGAYPSRFSEEPAVYQERRKTMLGMLLSGCARYQENVSREAFYVIGHELFGMNTLALEEKKEIYAFLSKKLLNLARRKDVAELTFFNDTMAWNSIYRFISEYLFEKEKFTFAEPQKVAFFPGTYDPFSLGHKEIAREIRDMGFVVYLALDEFSWSKKTQPHLVRRKILDISVANEENIYLFPENIPINIANPKDLHRLRSLFPGKEVYMVAGSDVVRNASSYRLPTVADAIQTFPHILFLRESGEEKAEREESPYTCIQNEVIELKLPAYFEDISSTRIRENIDQNRDISNLIDPVAQNYIYENSLYLREPQYKQLLKTKAVEILHLDGEEGTTVLKELAETEEYLSSALQQPASRMTIVFDQEGKGRPDAVMVYRHLATTELYGEFGDMDTAAYIRENTSGKIVLLTACWTREHSKIDDLCQILLTETLAKCLSEDFTYAIFSPQKGDIPFQQREVFQRQGFLTLKGNRERQIYVVDMKNPVTLYHNMQTALKEPFNGNERVLRTLTEAHHRFQSALTKLYPGELVISFDAGILQNQLIDLITKANHVPKEMLPVRTLGKKMCVPFGKILKGIAIPNTVTKMLHTEKAFQPDIRSFRIKEFPQYLPLDAQVRTIKSFRRPVILVDDLLHKGYRIRELDPIFKQENVDIDRIIVGVLSGRGRDLMEIQGRKAESAYFIPSLRAWFVETSMYPFIGGDAVEREGEQKGNLLPSVNLELPYVMPGFIQDASKEAIYDLSMTCLQNTKEILQILEEEYQRTFERSLTLGRLNEVIISPRCPDEGSCMRYEQHLLASVYVMNDIERLVRLQHLIK